MAITRTPIIDDDGTGETGTAIDNAWKQELYDQIDGLAGTYTPPVNSGWAATDASGAGLALTALGTFLRAGNLITVWGDVTFPVTSNAAGALLGNLPGTNVASHAGFYLTYGPFDIRFHVPQNTAVAYLMQGTTGAQLTNAQLSGAHLIFQGAYLIG